MRCNTTQYDTRKSIVHLTSVHPRNDTRIYIKQCRSLVSHDYEVTLVVADGLGDDTKDTIRIVDVGHRSGRLNRIFKVTSLVSNKAIELDADLYHIHDPELIPVGLKLKRLGKQVVFDSHEDVSKQLLGKPYLNPPVLKMLSNAFAMFERWTSPRFDAIVAATPFIRDKFLKFNPNSVDINNYPLIGELDDAVAWADKRNEVCYVGGIGPIRGVREMVRACEFLQTSTWLNLAGHFSDSAVKAEVRSYSGWERVNEWGFLDRTGVREVLGRSIAGLVTLHPLINYLDSLPVKMFEYMVAGIPVIASNFPYWRKIIEGNDCGICVDPFDSVAIAEAIDFLVANPERARQMGENGRRAVYERYNWSVEEAKLLNLYQNILR